MAGFDRNEIAKLVGLTPDASDATIRAAIAEVLASRRVDEDAARRERTLRAEDQRLVAAAIADGRILASRGQHWRHVLATSREANRALLASLASGVASPQRDVRASQAQSPNAELDHVLGMLGIPAANRASGTVHAAAPSPAQASPHVHAGTPLIPMPPAQASPWTEPLLPQPKRPVIEFTHKEMSDEMLRRALGHRSSKYLPPRPENWHYVGPNDLQWNEDRQLFEEKPQ